VGAPEAGVADARPGHRPSPRTAGAAPSPVHKGSTLGGFLAAQRRHGFDHYGQPTHGLVTALDVAPCDGSGATLHAEGESTSLTSTPYGITGVIVRPPSDWRPADWVGGVGGHAGLPTGRRPARAARLDRSPGWRRWTSGRGRRAAPATRAGPGPGQRAAIVQPRWPTRRMLLRRAGAEVLAVRSGLVAADRITRFPRNNHSTSTCRNATRSTSTGGGRHAAVGRPGHRAVDLPRHRATPGADARAADRDAHGALRLAGAGLHRHGRAGEIRRVLHSPHNWC